METSRTPLTPFRINRETDGVVPDIFGYHSPDNQGYYPFWTSDDARNIELLGYGYYPLKLAAPTKKEVVDASRQGANKDAANSYINARYLWFQPRTPPLTDPVTVRNAKKAKNRIKDMSKVKALWRLDSARMPIQPSAEDFGALGIVDGVLSPDQLYGKVPIAPSVLSVRAVAPGLASVPVVLSGINTVAEKVNLSSGNASIKSHVAQATASPLQEEQAEISFERFGKDGLEPKHSTKSESIREVGENVAEGSPTDEYVPQRSERPYLTVPDVGSCTIFLKPFSKTESCVIGAFNSGTGGMSHL